MDNCKLRQVHLFSKYAREDRWVHFDVPEDILKKKLH